MVWDLDKSITGVFKEYECRTNLQSCNNTGVLMMMMTIIHCPTMCVTHCLHSNALSVGVSLHL